MLKNPLRHLLMDQAFPLTTLLLETSLVVEMQEKEDVVEADLTMFNVRFALNLAILPQSVIIVLIKIFRHLHLLNTIALLKVPHKDIKVISLN